MLRRDAREHARDRGRDANGAARHAARLDRIAHRRPFAREGRDGRLTEQGALGTNRLAISGLNPSLEHRIQFTRNGSFDGKCVSE